MSSTDKLTLPAKTLARLTISNDSNHVFDTTIDEVFSARSWKRKSAA